jgi:hypothetical protein
MLSKIRKALLKFQPIRSAVEEYQLRKKEQERWERMHRLLKSGGMMR